MKLFRITWILVLVLYPMIAQSQEAPKLQVKQWLQAPKEFDGKWESLRGKVVVLEFWATWCSSCVAAIPHLNQLATEFRNEGVVFLAITDDDTDRLKSFLPKHPVDAIIGIDPDLINLKTFNGPSLPHTVLVGTNGVVIGATSPEHITSEVLRDTLAGRKLSLPPKEGIQCDLSWDENSIEWKDGVAPLMYAIIKPIKTLTAGYHLPPNSGHFTADGVPISMVLLVAYQTDSLHMDWRMPRTATAIYNQYFRVVFRVPEERKDRLLPYMRQTIADMFGIQAYWEKQEREVYVLRRIKGQALPQQSRAEKEVELAGRGTITLRYQPVSILCKWLTNYLRAITVDETGMEGQYDLDVAYQDGNPELMFDALKKLGLEAVKMRRNVSILVVEPEEKTP
jgi:uncharacterized protein (TIGR03435 family)